MSVVEKSLIEKSKQGDIESFEILIKDQQKLVFNIAYRMLGNVEDAKDAAQETFIKAYKSLHNFKGTASFSTWLYRIATNTCFDALRKRKAQCHYSYDKPIETEEGQIVRNIPDTHDLPEEIVEKREFKKNMQNAIHTLPEHHRMVIILRDVKGFSYEQISEILDCSQGTVKSRISRARNALKHVLEKDMELYNTDYVNI
ncbi:sigma-70 family RNA polymerase sigma factor [Clostridiaceae bacterium 35-E11]